MSKPEHSRLPHWYKPGTSNFLTWRLAGSLPVSRVADVYTSEGAKFVAKDKLLDARATGPKWLSEKPVAEAVLKVLLDGRDRGFCELSAWVIMPNHVHILLYPFIDLTQIVSGIKKKSAKEANRILNRTGAFWSRDYFDHWIRDHNEHQRIIRYIENNPIKAGLCSSAEAWPFSSANQRA